jgi:hypothetical protein
MNPLIAQIRKARLSQIEVGGRKFTIRRPTDLEAATMASERLSPFDVVLKHVVDWQVCERDIVSQGGDAAVPFDADLFAEWVVDQPDLWQPLAEAVMGAYARHRDAMEAAAKN